MKKLIVGAIAFCIGAISSAAEPSSTESGQAAAQAESLIKVVTKFCIEPFKNPEQMINALKAQQAAPEVMTSAFLNNAPGRAWFVPGDHGAYAVAIPDNNSSCKAFARDATATAVSTRFAKLLKEPLAGYRVKAAGEEVQVVPDGEVRTYVYRLYEQQGEGESGLLIRVETSTSVKSMFKASAEVSEFTNRRTP